MALSYVWGMATQFMLTTEALKPGFFESLGTRIPQSIQDAIQVCRNIGVRHIWIDALCIIQDDNKDKKDQIALMDEIYGHALAVLIGAAGDDTACSIPGLDAERAAVDAYGYKIPEDTVSIQFFVFNKDGKLESFFLEEPEGPPKEASAKSRTQEMMDWMMLANQQIQDPNVSFEEVQANLQENYAAKLALKDVQPTEKSVLEEKERIST
ncbi:hypothetical protein ACMFMG_010238 [Clarireedia jacksonii]